MIVDNGGWFDSRLWIALSPRIGRLTFCASRWRRTWAATAANRGYTPSQTCESFNGRFRDELLVCEQFNTLLEVQVLAEDWRIEYNTYRCRRSRNSPGVVIT